MIKICGNYEKIVVIYKANLNYYICYEFIQITI